MGESSRGRDSHPSTERYPMHDKLQFCKTVETGISAIKVVPKTFEDLRDVMNTCWTFGHDLHLCELQHFHEGANSETRRQLRAQGIIVGLSIGVCRRKPPSDEPPRGEHPKGPPATARDIGIRLLGCRGGR